MKRLLLMVHLLIQVLIFIIFYQSTGLTYYPRVLLSIHSLTALLHLLFIRLNRPKLIYLIVGLCILFAISSLIYLLLDLAPTINHYILSNFILIFSVIFTIERLIYIQITMRYRIYTKWIHAIILSIGFITLLIPDLMRTLNRYDLINLSIGIILGLILIYLLAHYDQNPQNANFILSLLYLFLLLSLWNPFSGLSSPLHLLLVVPFILSLITLEVRFKVQHK